MSADNYYAVYPSGDKWIVVHGFMSAEMEDCMYRGSQIGMPFPSREEALVAAHNLAQNDYVVEYGVIELGPIPDKPCGRCFVCVHERRVIDPSLRRCDVCGETISDSESVTMYAGQTMHSHCDSQVLTKFMNQAVEKGGE